jgi:outer membrane protein assembly factor BamB
MEKELSFIKRVGFGASAVALMILAVAPTAMAATPQGEHSEFNEPGNILISDQFNNRVIEINPKTHQVVWSFGDGSSVAGPHSIVGVNDAQRVGTLTLMAGTGTPPSPADPSCTNTSGCADNRVMLVNKAGQIVWQYGMAGVTGSGNNQLNTPVQATYLPNGHVLITDQGNQRVIEVNQKKEIVWQYGMTGTSGNGPNQLNNPNSAELLRNGHILIADENNNRVIEVTRDHQIVWQYPMVIDTNLLNGSAFASRLCNGNTLITDSNNNRIVEVTMAGHVVWTYATNTRPGSIDNPLPTRAVRLRNGNTLISDQYNDQVIEVNKAGKIVFSQGMIQVDGKGFNQLNAPYDAKVIGDFTGLTPPAMMHDADDRMHTCDD